MGNEKIAREIIQIAKAISAGPRSEYEADKARIEKAQAALAKAWEKTKKKYEKQLKDSPASWAGIGRGSELPDLARKIEDAAEMAAMMAR
jgi:hypothetical protein